MTIQSMNLNLSDSLADELRLLNANILASRGIIVTGHINPDGDNIGSQLALGEYFEQIGKKYILLDEDPLPAFLRFLPNTHMIKTLRENKINSSEYDLVIVVDSGDLPRIGGVADVFTDSMKIVNIDHHLGNTLFGDMNIIHETASSIGEILYYFFRINNIGISMDMASDLFVSIVTDTGFFRYDQTSPEVHMIAADLISHGISPNYFHIQLNMMKSLGYTRLLSLLLSRMELFEDSSIAFSYLLIDDFTGYSDIDTDTMIEHLGMLDSVSVYFLIKEKKPKLFGASLRSKYDVDVAKIASALGGGGHMRAAGCRTDEMPFDDFRDKLLTLIIDEVQAYQH
ncbi:MAG: bifunctional oligoribonuclease/PAP phosphatase NrnA [Brevinematales bacterium]|nr:bifunctional oligoribonuclease/PAP phosphatase NrnA [Brevinematales bacterium]